MALTSNGTFLHVTMADKGGNTSTLRYELSFADLDALNLGRDQVSDVITALGAVTDAAIVTYSVGEIFEESTGRFGDGEVEEVAITTHEIANALGKYVSIRIPAPKSAIFVNDGAPGPRANEVDTADDALLNYLTYFAAGGCIKVSDGETIVTPTATSYRGKRIHRGSRKG